MLIRYGYVAMSVHVANASPSRTMTMKTFLTLADRKAAIRRLERIAAENLHNTLRLLKYNKGEGIRLYRMSSKLIPLLTHEELAGWNPIAEALQEDFAAVGKYALQSGIRLSFHPDHFTVLSTPRPDVLEKSVLDLDRHVAMLEAMGLDERAKCNIHIGGSYGNKAKAFDRFLQQCGDLPDRIRHRLTLENDDKTFNVKETLEACQALGVPMVLDIHHHAVNHEGERIADLWPDITATWAAAEQRYAALHPGVDAEDWFVPKVHVSSPKSERDPRSHADYVDCDEFYAFAKSIAAMSPRLDVMIEAKQKDDALLRLLEEICSKPGVERGEGASVVLEV